LNSPVLTFWISIAALIVAALAAFYARTQALAASETAKIERRRDHDERTPKFTARLIMLPGLPPKYLLLKLETAEEITSLEIDSWKFFLLDKGRVDQVRMKQHDGLMYEISWIKEHSSQADLGFTMNSIPQLGDHIALRINCESEREAWSIAMHAQVVDSM
jgi:hypothetical protein